jgi:predicted nucleotidyltransferase
MRDEVVRRLVAEFDPEQIVLFGSHAWGTPTEDSDVDLLVIVTRSDSSPAQRSAQAHRCLRGVLIPMDLLVKTREEVERFAGVPASLEAEILQRGKVIYGRCEARSRAELADQGTA